MRHASSSAAALAAVALLVSACSSDADVTVPGDGATDQATVDPTPADSPTSEPSIEATTNAGASLAFGAPITHGHGVVVSAVPDGSALWVTAPEPRNDQFGCEGVAFEFLQVLDPATGDRQRAFPELADDDQPFVTALRISPQDPTRVLLVSGCEGFLGRVDVGDVQADGTITGVTSVPLPEGVELGGATIRWVGPDTISGVGIEAYDTPGLFLHDLASGEWMDIDPTPLVDWVPLADGLAVEVLFDQARVVDEEGVVVDNLAVNEVVTFAGDFPLLASDYGSDGSTGRTILVTGVGEQRLLDELGGFGMGFSPDARYAAWTALDPAGDVSTTTILDLRTDAEVVVEGVWFAGIAWLDGGIAFTSQGPLDAEGFSVPTVTFLPIS